MEVSDSELLRRFAADRDQAAFTALVERHFGVVFHAARRQLGDAHRAEDVAQAVFAIVARKAHRLASHQSIAGWLHTTTRYEVGRVRRTEHRRGLRELEVVAMSEDHEPPALPEDVEKLTQFVDEALSALSDRDREVVLLRYFEGLPFAAVGARVGVSENSARMRVERALAKLQRLLARHGVTSTEAAFASALTVTVSAATPAAVPAQIAGAVLAGLGTGAAAGSGAGISCFMATTKIWVGGAVLTAIAATTGFLREHELRARAENAARSAQAEATEALAVASRLRQSLPEDATHANSQGAFVGAAPSPVSGSSAESVSSAAARPASAVASPAKVAPARAGKPLPPETGNMSNLFQRPDAVELIAKQNRNNVALLFGPLYRSLGLSPEQIARFEAEWIAGQDAGAEVMAAANSQGITSNDEAALRLAAEAVRASDANIRSLLGEDGYRAYNAARLSFAAPPGAPEPRKLTQSLAGSLYYTDTPLTADQGARLTQLLTEQRRLGARGNPQVAQGQIDWDAVTVRLGTILSEPQIEALRAVRVDDECTRQLEAIRDAMLREAAAAVADEQAAGT